MMHLFTEMLSTESEGYYNFGDQPLGELAKAVLLNEEKLQKEHQRYA